MDFQADSHWYVIQAAHNGALKAQEQFNNHKIDSFIPMEMRDVVVKGGKTKRKLMPVFLNLIFADVSFRQLCDMKILNKDLWYVNTVVDGEKQPMTVPRDEMKEFIDFVNGNFQHLEYIDTQSFNLEKGERVRITDGPFAGKVGIFVKVKGKRNKQVVIAVDGLLAVEIIHPNPSQIIERI